MKRLILLSTFAFVLFSEPGYGQWTKHYIDEDLDGATDVYVADIDDNNDLDIVATAGTTDDVVWYENTMITGIESFENKSYSLSLSNNYPNPFSGKTVAGYKFQVAGYVELTVFDINGNKIATFINQKQSPGKYEVEFDAGGLPAGIYYCWLRVGKYSQTKKMVLINKCIITIKKRRLL